MYENQFTSPLRPLALAILTGLVAVVVSPAFAGEDDTPLSLTLSQGFTRDSNFTKDDTNKVGDTISTTAAQVSLNKAYGRQNYQAGLKLSKQQHAHFKDLNFDGKDANAALSTEVARNWLLSANGVYADTLNPVQNNGLTGGVEKNVKKYRDGGFSAQYGNGGTWAVAGSIDANKQSYSSIAQQGQNANQRTTGLKAIYFVSDALQYSLGARRVVTKYELNTTYDQVIDRNIDLSTQLQITGLTNLRATLTRRATSYVPTDPSVVLPNNGGWTGDFNWQYTPHGIASYNLGFSRTTGSDRQQSTNPQEIAQNVSIHGYGSDTVTSKINNNTVTSTISLNGRAQLTGKLSATSSYAVSQFKIDRAYTVDFKHSLDLNKEGASSVDSYNHALTFGVDYTALRSLRLGCSYQRYSQGYDGIYHIKYSGNSVDCNVNFTLNP